MVKTRCWSFGAWRQEICERTESRYSYRTRPIFFGQAAGEPFWCIFDAFGMSLGIICKIVLEGADVENARKSTAAKCNNIR